jgi:plastocyanin
MQLRTIAAFAATTLLLSCNGTANTSAPAASGTTPPGTTASTNAGVTTSTSTSTSTTTTTTPVTVTIQGFKYNPASITVKAGDSVVFKNMDSTAHTVTPVSGASFTDSGTIAGSGGTATVTFPTAGTANYKCNFHPSMLGSVTVQ